jgi:UDP-N-acetylmuramyl tripeptide synthase
MPQGLLVVSGSSGKSTTTKMLAAILRAHGSRVFTNQSTANIRQGLASALVDELDALGRSRSDVAVIELDEGHGALIAPTLRPHTVVLTNVMTDQIDRFTDPSRIVGMLHRIAARAGSRVVSNADDALLERMLADAAVPVERYGTSAAVFAASPMGSLETTPSRLQHGTRVLEVSGRTARIEVGGVPLEVPLPARGTHYAVDAAAALTAARSHLGERFDAELAVAAIASMPAVFGRGEVVEVQGKPVEFVLVQNPGSYELNIAELDAGLDQLMVAVGSDVRDPSYFWPVDTSRLGHVQYVSGSKAAETALQLLYQGVEIGEVDADLPGVLDRFLAQPTPASGVKTIVFSADSMRRTRAHWGLT